MKHRAFILALAASTSLLAQTVPVPNASFESPETDFAFPVVDAWQSTPKPDWYDEGRNGPWAQLVGVFKNPTPEKPDHIPNMLGDQALFLFNLPQAGIFQDYNSIGGTNSAPSHEFAAVFQPGHAYTLTVGAIGGGGGMTNGASLLMSLYYRDANGQFVTVAAQPIVHSTNLFPTTTHLVDVTLETPVVQASDAWAGKNIGIMFVSTSGAQTTGGYWDLDNVRLTRREPFAVPNASFESPKTDFAFPVVDAWQTTPKPDWYDEGQNGPWAQLVGVFKNPTPEKSDHIPNMLGDQALFLFNLPQAGIFQDYDSIGGTNSAPSHEFNLKFEPGQSYSLTVGAIGGGGGMTNGASLLMSLYYRDANGQFVTVAAQPIVHSTNLFPTTTHLVDVTLETPVVQATDAWAGKNVGVMFVSTSGAQTTGGYWDLDNVRLEVRTAGPKLSVTRGAALEISWPAQAGHSYQVEVSQDLRVWTRYGAPVETSADGTATRTAPLQEFSRAFFRVLDLE